VDVNGGVSMNSPVTGVCRVYRVKVDYYSNCSNCLVFAGLTPWGERLIIEIMPPKPDVPSHPVPYRLLNRRCSYHDCNRLYATAERSNKPTFDRSILANDR
jgi:hypothetical protein